ncbi:MULTISPECIES: hypothetical protein [Bacillus cereus group]|uniref:Uncharacterized protein n=1 Tax=Bacillus pseudomycoides TaxID=64104 RepID=A0ABD6TC54_9BACI|nr:MULTISPECIES: hypothetical protein [Bacillus cereus group]MBJ8028525.1 hypothetical protein [Bacillus cereus group sp. N21]MCR8858737.1 hypothetical protein [Bacillus pseudomycoides]MED1621793.1 hypothetical protein [Bacillus pseudomycoides]PDZ11004.1 hypothetical protein CON70_14280 [Bacillus pseudomycoides]PDZ70858.1 hypothetical protein CON58_26600 [Bacillus pseudomycoides]
MLKIKKTSETGIHIVERLSLWPKWIGYVAGAWSFMYFILGLYWALGGKGFPLGIGDPHSEYSMLAGLRPEIGAPMMVGFGLMGVIVAVLMILGWGKGLFRMMLLTFVYMLVAILLFAVIDYRILATAAYGIVFLVGAPFDFPSEANFFEHMMYGTVINQYISMLGSFLWIATALAYQRQTRNACPYCGRNSNPSKWTSQSSAASWGKWCTYIAIIIPICYSITRWCWAIGIPLGTTKELLDSFERDSPGIWLMGASLATVALGGAILTLGLIQRWGENFPRWFPFVAGKRVPLSLAIIPASLVSIMVTSAGLMYIRGFINKGGLDHRGWALEGPELLWPIWGVALFGATIAYYYRRRNKCRHCGSL